MSNSQPPQVSNSERACILILMLSPVALLLASLVASFTDVDWAYNSGLGLGLVIGGGGVFALINLFLSFVRPLLYRLRHGSLESLSHESGIPMIGSTFVLMGGVLGFGDVAVALSGLVVLALDTGGTLWALFHMWRYGLY